MMIYLGNIPYQHQEEFLRTWLQVNFPKLTIIMFKLVTGTDGKTSRGFAFIEIPDDEALLGAGVIKELHGSELNGRTLKCRLARPRRKRKEKPFDKEAHARRFLPKEKKDALKRGDQPF